MAQAVEILLVEDSPSDVALTREALRRAREDVRLHVARDGVEAIAFLRRQERFREVPRPHLVLLDLNLPRKDGREVLAEVKADHDLGRIPVVVLTSSAAEADIRQAYELHANAYVVKPPDFERFCQVLLAIESFWFQLVRLPPA